MGKKVLPNPFVLLAAPNCGGAADDGDPKDGTFDAGFDALNENAGGFAGVKLNAGEVLPKAGGAVNAAFVFKLLSAGFAPNIPVV